MSEDNVALRRKAYLSREISRSLTNFPASDEITRQVVAVALRSISMFDTREYAIAEWQRFFEEGQSDATMNAIYFECLSNGVIKGKERCDTRHEHPKSCDCEGLFKVILGIVPAVMPLGEPNE